MVATLHHYITTSSARRLSPDKLAVAKEEFREMKRMGIIRKLNSPWASPLYLILKSQGEWRPCHDYVGSTMLLHLIVIPLLICKTFLPN